MFEEGYGSLYAFEEAVNAVVFVGGVDVVCAKAESQ